MSLMPIDVVANCEYCGHYWVEQKNTLDALEKECPTCQNKVLVF